MAPGVRRVLAPNPGPMTYHGTNSYLVGAGEVAVIDPGPADDAHLGALMAALAPGERVVAILVTHPHLDHSAGAPALATATGAPVMGFGPAGSGLSVTMARLAAAGLTGAEGVDAGFRPDRLLAEGDAVAVGEGRLVALHTPGHMGAHLAFAFGATLFTGDLAMGWASSLVSPPEGDMAAYMGSLARLAAGRWDRLLPGHGPEVTAPAARLAELIAHRRQREAEVLAALAQAPGTAADLAQRIYRDTPPALLPAAARNVLAHLIDLGERGLAVPADDPGPAAIFHPA